MRSLTVEEIESEVGEKLRALRLLKNIDQQRLAAQAGIGVTALKNLENGSGSTLKTLIKVMRALKREAWFDNIAPIATVSPLTMTSSLQPRQRARAVHKR